MARKSHQILTTRRVVTIDRTCQILLDFCREISLSSSNFLSSFFLSTFEPVSPGADWEDKGDGGTVDDLRVKPRRPSRRSKINWFILFWSFILGVSASRAVTVGLTSQIHGFPSIFDTSRSSSARFRRRLRPPATLIRLTYRPRRFPKVETRRACCCSSVALSSRVPPDFTDASLWNLFHDLFKAYRYPSRKLETTSRSHINK